MARQHSSSRPPQPGGRSPFSGALPAIALKALEPCDGGFWVVTSQSEDAFSVSYLVDDGSEVAAYTMTPCMTEEQVHKLCKKHLYTFSQKAQSPTTTMSLDHHAQATASPATTKNLAIDNSGVSHQPEIKNMSGLYFQNHPQIRHPLIQSDFGALGTHSPPQDNIPFVLDNGVFSHQSGNTALSTVGQPFSYGAATYGIYGDFGDIHAPHCGEPIQINELGSIPSDTNNFLANTEEPFNPILADAVWNPFENEDSLEVFFTRP